MNKLLVIDENAGVAKVMSDILAQEDGSFTLYGAATSIEAEDILSKENPPIALVRADSQACIAAAELLQEKSNEIRFILMSRNMERQTELIKKFNPLVKINLPFDPDEFADMIEEAFSATQI